VLDVYPVASRAQRLRLAPRIVQHLPTDYQTALQLISNIPPGRVTIDLPAPQGHQVAIGVTATRCQVEPIFSWLDQASREWLTSTFYPGGSRLSRGTISSPRIRELWLDRLTPATHVVVNFAPNNNWNSTYLGRSQSAIVPGPLTDDEASLLARLLAHDLYDVEQAIRVVQATLT
jgi:hypothetical protein